MKQHMLTHKIRDMPQHMFENKTPSLSGDDSTPLPPSLPPRDHSNDGDSQILQVQPPQQQPTPMPPVSQSHLPQMPPQMSEQKMQEQPPVKREPTETELPQPKRPPSKLIYFFSKVGEDRVNNDVT